MTGTGDSPGKMDSFFRTRAWVQSWLDIWGKNPQLTLIDVGGRSDPLEMLYLINHKIKGIIPAKSLAVAGYGFADFCPPRAEYNNLDSLIKLSGGIKPLMTELYKLSWDQFGLTDFTDQDSNPILMQANLDQIHIVRTHSELAYRIKPMDFDLYKAQMSASTRTKYFNHRRKLIECGELDFRDYEKARDFFNVLNEFHKRRWGRPCYAPTTMDFFALFIERIRQEGGRPLLQAMRVDGEIVSVLFDIVWGQVRYNLQSGYDEGRFGQLALGSLHLGFAIEHALGEGFGYDFLAGSGKHTNYKQKISNEAVPMQSFCLARGWLKYLYRIYGK